jgi:hypothetical protein
MRQEHRLMIAYGIATWASSIDNMAALAEGGEPTLDHAQRLRGELEVLVLNWPNVTLPLTDQEVRRIVDEARVYCTEHQPELNQLLRELTTEE